MQRDENSNDFPRPENEAERIKAVERYDILDTVPEKPFDALTRTMARFFDVPIALFSIMDRDRQWFKSAHGLDLTETDRSCAICNYTIVDGGLFVVPDAHEDERFRENRLVTGEISMRYYAGYPLYGENGYALGTICLIDTEPRDIDRRRLESLEDFAQQAEALLDLQLKNKNLQTQNQELTRIRSELEQALDNQDVLLNEVQHRVKNNLQMIASFLRLQGRESDEPSVKSALDESGQRVRAIALIHERLHELDHQTHVNFRKYCRDLISSIIKAYEPTHRRIDHELHVSADPLDVGLVLPLGLIISEAVMNSLEHGYTDRETGTITLKFSDAEEQYILEIRDDGSGLPEDFDAYEDGSFGLRMIRLLSEDQLGGELDVYSDDGTVLALTMPGDAEL